MKKKHSDEEYRNVTFDLQNVECRKSEDNGTAHVSGVAVVFGQETRINGWDDYDEIIDRHALDETDMSDVALFANHESNRIPFARSRNGNGTLHLEIREDGLHFDTDLDIEGNPSAAELYSALSRGDIDKCSFAFRIGEQTWSRLDDGQIPLRTINKISILHEVSIVNYPAYSGTSATARSEEETSPCQSLAEARKRFSEGNRAELELAKAKARALSI